MSEAPRPVTILVGALGGEGGGVLTDWLVSAATAADLPVQSTSIPGVAQRTGATTYYLEMYPVPVSELGARRPVMALYPGPGDVDLVVASELLEAGRAIELGYVSPDRTTLVASTHRIYSIAEKSAMDDARYDGSRIVDAARELSARPVLVDLAAVAAGAGAQINSVLLGAIAGTGVLPLTIAALAGAIERGGKAVETNLRGFRAGLAAVESAAAGEQRSPSVPATPLPPPTVEERLAALPASVREIAAEGAALAEDYLDAAYARLYLDRVESVAVLDGGADDHALGRECARELALWMCYEDVIRVADLKSRPERLARVRAEVGARPHEPVQVTEFLKPGLEEICAIAPPRLARWLRRVAGARRPSVGLRLRTDTVTGFVALRFLARLARWRRSSERFRHEQALLDWWLDAVRRASAVAPSLALEVVACAGLNKGYGETFERGRGNFRRVVAIADGAGDAGARAEAMRAAREAALADPSGHALDGALGAPPAAKIIQTG